MATGESGLRLTDDTRVHLADGMYSFCILLRFAFDGQPSAAELIEAVLAHPRYRSDCISRWTGPCEGIHGPYRLETLTVGGFRGGLHGCCSATGSRGLAGDKSQSLGQAAGFHEFITIDRRNAALTVIIATDD